MNLKNAFVIFAPIDDQEKNRFLAGEIEASPALCNTEVQRIKTYSLNKTNLKAGKSYSNRGDGIMLGFVEGRSGLIPVASEASEVTVISNDDALLTILEKGKMGTSRVVSSTGLKGVLKPMRDLGMATVEINSMTVNIPVDIITGPNAVKTDKGSNTIALAKATAALYYGLGGEDDKVVDSRNEDQVNRLAALWPDCEYQGKSYPCGILQIQATEIGADYAKLKPLVFSFVMLKYLKEDGYKELFDTILAEGRDDSVVEPILELYKCYMGLKESLEVVTPARIKKLINLNDLPQTSIQDFPPEGWLFSEENTGFLVRVGKHTVRIPSGKLLTEDCTIMRGGVMIGATTLAVARIMRDIIQGRNLFYDSATHPANQLKGAIRSVLFTADGASENRASELIKPKLVGINLKQISECKLPIDVIAVPDNIYEKMRRKIFGKEDPSIVGDSLFTLSCRNPALWRMQLRKFETISLSMANEQYGCNMDTDSYMVAMSPDAMMEARSDCDGDLLPIFLVHNQEALRDFKTLFVTQAEIDWIQTYTEGEYKEFVIKPYKLNNISWESFRSYLLDANLTKSAVGTATNDSWAFQFLLEAYRGEYYRSGGVIQHNGKSINLKKVSRTDAIALYSVFIFLLQDNVISGIKHSSGGSNIAREFSLQLMDKSKIDLIKGYNLDPSLVTLLFYILEWGRKRKYTSVVMKFLRLANKGIHPQLEPGEDDRFEIFQQVSLLGLLTKPLRDIDALVEAENSESVLEKSSDLF